jgi:hypothetical protein
MPMADTTVSGMLMIERRVVFRAQDVIPPHQTASAKIVTNCGIGFRCDIYNNSWLFVFENSSWM